MIRGEIVELYLFLLQLGAKKYRTLGWAKLSRLLTSRSIKRLVKIYFELTNVPVLLKSQKLEKKIVLKYLYFECKTNVKLMWELLV